MTLAQRLLPLALLSIASHSSQAAGSGAIEPYAAAALPFSASATLSTQDLWRAIRQPDGRPALRFGPDDRRPGGWSAATWAARGADRAGNGGIDRHELNAGLSRKLDGGWALSGTYGRASGAIGAAGGGAFERAAGTLPRPELRPLSGGKVRGGAVLMTLSRRF
jgi:hypothetical protein